MRTRSAGLLCLFLLFLLGFAGPALGTPITVNFDGLVASSTGGTVPAPGEGFSGVLVYDDSAPDAEAGPTFGGYPISSLDVLFSGGYSFSSSVVANISIQDDPGGDRWGVLGYDIVDPNVQLGFVFDDPSGTALSSDALVPPVLVDYSDDVSALLGSTDLAFLTVTSITVVPEPSTALLMGLGLLSLAHRRRRSA